MTRDPPRPAVFRRVATACTLFFLLTAAATLLYPGGSVADHQSRGYSFFENFFSDLGQTRTLSGASNIACLTLFGAAMALAASRITLFFAFARFFSQSRAGRAHPGDRPESHRLHFDPHHSHPGAQLANPFHE